jgi:hypothetical protein
MAAKSFIGLFPDLLSNIYLKRRINITVSCFRRLKCLVNLAADFAKIHIQHIYKESLMAQLHCYVPEEIAQQAQRRANQSGLSLSRYLAELVKRDAQTSTAWPEGYFDIFGRWEGKPLERPKQLPLEVRQPIK